MSWSWTRNREHTAGQGETWHPALDPKLNPGRAPWPGITRPDDIWRQNTKAATITGTTSARASARAPTRSAISLLVRSGSLLLRHWGTASLCPSHPVEDGSEAVLPPLEGDSGRGR